jgi:hypothetical protein
MFVNNVKEQGKSASQSDFFSFISSNTESDEVSKTLEGNVDSLCSLLLRFFKLNNADLEAMIGSMPELASIKERGLNQSILAEVDSNEALTERGRYQVCMIEIEMDIGGDVNMCRFDLVQENLIQPASKRSTRLMNLSY